MEIVKHPRGTVMTPSCKLSSEQAPTKPTHSGDGTTVCAICFEEAAAIPLPCLCRTCYCVTCWDRALAASVATCGKAQCPSCRMSLHVDLDVHGRGLVFSPGVVQGRRALSKRIYQKTRPTQIQLLKDFGAGLVDDLVDDSQRREAAGAKPHKASPSCLCGAALQCLDGRGRIRRVVTEAEISQEVLARCPRDEDALTEMLIHAAVITCDLCRQPALTSTDGIMWTCPRGSHTLLHPVGYDICADCIYLHIGRDAERCMARRLAIAAPRGRLEGLLRNVLKRMWMLLPDCLMAEEWEES